MSQRNGATCKQVQLQIGENCNRDASNVGAGLREGSREQEMCLRFREGKKRLRKNLVRVGHRQAEPQKLSRKCDKCWHKKAAIEGARFSDVNAIKDRVTAIMRSIPQEVFADCSCKLYERCQTVLYRMATIVKCNNEHFVCIFCFVCFLLGFTELFRHTVYKDTILSTSECLQ